MRLTLLRRGGAAAVIVTGLALFASALQGVTRMDASLQLAADRKAPDRALMLETSGERVAHRWGCDGEHRRKPRV